MQDQLYCTAWQNVSAPGGIRKIVRSIFKNSNRSLYTSFVVNEAVLGQIFLLDFHFSPATNCCRHRRWYISWYVTSAPLLPRLILNSFKSQNHFPEFLNMTSTLFACRCHGGDCGNEHSYNYWTDFNQIWYRFIHIKSRQANTVLFHVVIISKPFFTKNSKYILTNSVKTKRPS